jgi:hypothetical protein
VQAAEQLTLASDIAEFYADPLGYVLYAFPWGTGKLVEESGPDEWQIEILNEIGQEVLKRDDGVLETAVQLAVSSGHGIGKTALISWIILWFISTRPNPQIIVTANTEQQLRTKTWRELSKWQQLAINGDWFEWSATKFALKEQPQTWFASAIPWTEHNSEAFAGAHEKYVLVIYDEASAISDSIWEVSEGAMTTTGAIWIAFGNPTKNTGRFRECFGRFRHRWLTRQVDSRTAKMANKAQIDQWVDDYGEDSDFVRIRVRGVFPRAGSNQFIPCDVVDACKVYKAHGYESQSVLIGVDVARFGDDQTVICIRQGRKLKKLIKYRGLDTMQTAGRVVEVIQQYKKATCFVDGVGVGGGVVDRLRQLGHEVVDINAGGSPTDGNKYKNKRAEMWDLMREWLKAGAEIPAEDHDLYQDLTGIEYGFTPSNQIQMEKKEDMKKRGLASPDCADALSLTFAFPVGAGSQKLEYNDRWIV